MEYSIGIVPERSLLARVRAAWNANAYVLQNGQAFAKMLDDDPFMDTKKLAGTFGVLPGVMFMATRDWEGAKEAAMPVVGVAVGAALRGSPLGAFKGSGFGTMLGDRMRDSRVLAAQETALAGGDLSYYDYRLLQEELEPGGSDAPGLVRNAVKELALADVGVAGTVVAGLDSFMQPAFARTRKENFERMAGRGPDSFAGKMADTALQMGAVSAAAAGDIIGRSAETILGRFFPAGMPAALDYLYAASFGTAAEHITNKSFGVPDDVRMGASAWLETKYPQHAPDVPWYADAW